jgi:DNA-binding Lrp family transcriptional regulator
MKERVDVSDTEVARVLTDIPLVRLLEPFFKKETTLSDAAKELNVKLTTLLYHVNKFVRLGVLEVTKEEARKGKAIKYYQASAASFFVPFHITPSLSLKHLLEHITQPSYDIFNREVAKVFENLSSDWGIEICSSKHDAKSVTVSIKRKDKLEQQDTSTSFDPDEPAFFGSLGDFHLDFTTAKEFERELRELLERYRKKQTSTEQLYFYRIGLTPAQDESFEPKD